MSAHRRRARLGVVGCGRVFERGHLPAILRSPAFELAAVLDPSAERVALARAAAPSVRVASSLAELVEAVDAVLVATPPWAHRDVATSVLSRGRAAFVEKPMGASLGDARAIRAAAEASGAALQVGFVRRFRAPYRALRERLSERRPGETLEAWSQLVFAPGAWGPVTRHLGRAEAGGGALFDVASHQVDLVAWLFASRVRAVVMLERTADDAGERIRYELELSGGQRIRCEAAHADTYRERFGVVTSGETLLARAYGVERRAQGRALPSERWLDARDRAHLLAARLRGRRSVTAESFVAQLAAFARLRAGDRGVDAPGADDGVRAHAVLAACARSASGGGLASVEEGAGQG